MRLLTLNKFLKLIFGPFFQLAFFGEDDMGDGDWSGWSGGGSDTGGVSGGGYDPGDLFGPGGMGYNDAYDPGTYDYGSDYWGTGRGSGVGAGYSSDADPMGPTQTRTIGGPPVDLNRYDPARDKGLGLIDKAAGLPGLLGKVAGGIGTLSKQGTLQSNLDAAGIPYSDWGKYENAVSGLGDPFGEAINSDLGGYAAGDSYRQGGGGYGGGYGGGGYGGGGYGISPVGGAGGMGGMGGAGGVGGFGGFGGAGGITGGTGTQWGPYAGMPQQQMYETMFPSMQRLFSGNPYDVPDVNMMMPTASNMGSMDPSIMEGIMQPFKQAESQLQETLGAGGALGSARGGFSGAGAAGLGKFWGQAAPQIGQTAWGMMAPQLQQNWEAQLNRNRAPMQFAAGQMPSIYPSPVVTPPTEKASSMENALGWTTAAKNIWDIFS